MTERQFRGTWKLQRRIRKENVRELVPLPQGPRKMILPKLRAGAGRPSLARREEQNLQTVSVLHEAPAQGEQIGSRAARTDL